MKHFTPPTLEEVRAYCTERKNGINPEKFLAHYESVGWVQGKAKLPIKNWKAAIVRWEINSREYSSAPTITLTKPEQKVIDAYICEKGYQFPDDRARVYFEQKNLANARNLLKLAGSDEDIAVKAIRGLSYHFRKENKTDWHFGWILNNFCDWDNERIKRKMQAEEEAAGKEGRMRKLDALIFKSIKTFNDKGIKHETPEEIQKELDSLNVMKRKQS